MSDRHSPKDEFDFHSPTREQPEPPAKQHSAKGSSVNGSSKDAKEARSRGDPRSEEEIKKDDALATRLSSIIEEANRQVVPICKMIRKHIETFEAKKEEDREEDQLIGNVEPLLEQAKKILNETNGSVHGADPDRDLTNRAQRNMADHVATPAEQRLAEALKVMVEHVQGTIDWAQDKLKSYPKAKKNLGPLLDALGQPLTQIIGGVALLLAGVLNLLGKLLSGLGLDSLLKGIVSATGLDKIYKGLGLDKWLNSK